MTQTKREKALPYLLFALSFAAFQAYYLFVRFLTVFDSYFAYGLLYAFLLVLFIVFVIGAEGSKLSRYGFVTFGRRATIATLSSAALLAVVYAVVVSEPGFIYGFVRERSPSIITFGFFLFSSPLVALTEEAIYRGYIFKSLAATNPVNKALLISSGLYALQLTNPSELLHLNSVSAQYLFSNVLPPFVIGIVMCIYFYKSGWSLLGPVVVRTGLLIQGSLSPFLARTPSFEFSFIFDLLGAVALIVLVNSLIHEPKFLARRYLGSSIGPKVGRFRSRAKARADMRRTLLQLSVAGVVVVSGVVGSQSAFNSSFHLSAIATGSMQPTLGIGTLVVVQGVTSPSQIRVGDIVEYNPTTPLLKGPIVHRVVEINETGAGPLFLTKGDHNPSPDPASFPFSRIIGREVFAIPLIGYTVLSPPLAVSLIAFLFLSSLFGSSFKRQKRGRTSPRGF